MKIQHDETNVTHGGSIATQAMKMDMSAKAIRLLSDGLYTNKIGSIVREICSNAKDSHVDNGTPEKAFTVHLPDMFEPYFEVQDYGVGLSPDDMLNVYGTYFASTKANSNDAVGAFGLGSKTPFAYSDQFGVRSVHNGTVTNYSVYMGSDGQPNIDTKAINPTDEPNGVSITIPVEKDDFREFTNEVKRQLAFFEVKPYITNDGGDFKWDNLPQAVMTIADVEILDQKGWNNNIHIIQGGVGYPLDSYEISNKLSHEHSQVIELLKHSGARMKFNIGEIGVTTSREGVEYKEHTIGNIKIKLEECRIAFKKHLSDILDSKPNLWNKARVLNESHTLRRIAQLVDFKLDGTSLWGGQYNFDLEDLFHEEFDFTDSYGDVVKRQRRLFKVVRYIKNDSTVTMTRANNTDTIDATNDHEAVYIRNEKSQPVARIKNHMIENDIDNLLVITISAENTNTLDDAFSKKFVKAVKKRLGGVPVLKVADLDKPASPISKPVSNRPIGFVALVTNPNQDVYSTQDWQRAFGPINDLVPAIYTISDRYDLVNDNAANDTRDWMRFVNAGLCDKALYTFTKIRSEKLSDKWIKLEDFIADTKKSLEDKYDDYADLCRAKVIHEKMVHVFYQAHIEVLQENVKKLDKGSLGAWITRMTLLSDTLHDRALNALTGDQRKFMRMFGSDVKQHHCQKTYDVCKKIDKARETFLLLQDGKWNMTSSEKEHIVKYVNCMSEMS